jgi:hypothetical protein
MTGKMPVPLPVIEASDVIHSCNFPSQRRGSVAVAKQSTSAETSTVGPED